MAARKEATKVQRDAQLQWVPIPQMKIHPRAQREFKPHRADYLVSHFDLEELGTLTVNKADDTYYVIDGQHRVAALKRIGYGDQQVQCWVYEGLSVEAMADKFLKLSDTLTIDALPRYRAAVTAGYPVESDIDRILHSLGLVATYGDQPGRVRAVGTLKTVYESGGPETLERALRIIREAYGDLGFDASVIHGMGAVCQRYNGQLDDEDTIKRLNAAAGGVSGLLSKANREKERTGGYKWQCVAAVVVATINRGNTGRKLDKWWKDS